MNRIRKIVFAILITAVLFSSVAVSAAAATEKASSVEKFYNYNEGLLCISHRGDTSAYPENSLEAVKSALKKGADFVSVNLEKTSDGVFYLCENESLGNICNAPYESLAQLKSEEVDSYFLYDVYGKQTDFRMTSLEKLLDETDGKDGIIIDVRSEYKDDVYSVLEENDALDRVIIRVEESGKSLSAWAGAKAEKVHIIGKYTGNIIFSTISQINSLTAYCLTAVQYESKNYFNVCFGEFFTNRYLHSGNVRAVAATYSPELCGQRSDSSDGWNELISKGYSVIETNNVEGFDNYRKQVSIIKDEIIKLIEKAETVDIEKYSRISFENLDKAKLHCKSVTYACVVSLAGAQEAYSQLNLALKEMKISTGEVETRGALNITAGKIVAVILVGTALLSGQIYVYKMRRSNREKNTHK